MIISNKFPDIQLMIIEKINFILIKKILVKIYDKKNK